MNAVAAVSPPVVPPFVSASPLLSFPQEANTAAELVQRSVDPEANIIFGVVTDESLGDEIQITVIATGFEKDENISTIGVENLVNNTWNKKINSIPSSQDNKADNPNDLDIPSFLRNKRK